MVDDLLAMRGRRVSVEVITAAAVVSDVEVPDPECVSVYVQC